jgi:hypothetical protein
MLNEIQSSLNLSKTFELSIFVKCQLSWNIIFFISSNPVTDVIHSWKFMSLSDSKYTSPKFMWYIRVVSKIETLRHLVPITLKIKNKYKWTDCFNYLSLVIVNMISSRNFIFLKLIEASNKATYSKAYARKKGKVIKNPPLSLSSCRKHL